MVEGPRKKSTNVAPPQRLHGSEGQHQSGTTASSLTPRLNSHSTAKKSESYILNASVPHGLPPDNYIGSLLSFLPRMVRRVACNGYDVQGFLHRGAGLNAPRPGDRWKCRKREEKVVGGRSKSGEAKRQMCKSNEQPCCFWRLLHCRVASS